MTRQGRPARTSVEPAAAAPPVGERHLIVEESAAASGRRVERVAPPKAVTSRGRDLPETEPIPAMTNDNTASGLGTTGSMMADSAASGVLNRVRPGMAVVDARGEGLGTVDHVKMGDPGAATVGADLPPQPGIFAAVFGAEGEPDVPEPTRSRLLRWGYVKVDGRGWIDTDRYVTADLIAGVAGETVTLAVAKERLIAEAS